MKPHTLIYILLFGAFLTGNTYAQSVYTQTCGEADNIPKGSTKPKFFHSIESHKTSTNPYNKYYTFKNQQKAIALMCKRSEEATMYGEFPSKIHGSSGLSKYAVINEQVFLNEYDKSKPRQEQLQAPLQNPQRQQRVKSFLQAPTLLQQYAVYPQQHPTQNQNHIPNNSNVPAINQHPTMQPPEVSPQTDAVQTEPELSTNQTPQTPAQSFRRGLLPPQRLFLPNRRSRTLNFPPNNVQPINHHLPDSSGK